MAVFRLKQDIIQGALDRAHITHARFARHLGLSRSYWSQLFNGRRGLSPQVRTWLLKSRYLKGIPESELWEISRSQRRAA